MEVLNLVNNPAANCFRNQVEALADLGVSSDTLSPPLRGEPPSGWTEQSRSVFDYLRFHPTVLRQAIDGYDLVHANYGLTAPAAVTQPIRPVVISLWGSDLLGQFGWVSRICARFADAVIVMSSRMATALSTSTPTFVIPHGVDMDLFSPQPRAQAREAVGWDRAGKHVLFPYPTARDVKDYPRARRVVAAVERQLDDAVTLHTLTGIDHERMPQFMNAADALLLTSKHEGSPATVKEALACNRPVISTDVGDVAERIAGVEYSAVCRTDAELVESLQWVLESGATASNGRAAVRGLSLEATGEQIHDVYRAVLSGTARSDRPTGGTLAAVATP